MSKHVHSFERHALSPWAPRAGYESDYGWNAQPWPESVRAYICACGEPGFEIPREAERREDDDA